MIKYPVKVGEFDDELGGYGIYDADSNTVAHLEGHCIDFDAKLVANTIANALNAMNDVPKSDGEFNDWIVTNSVRSWLFAHVTDYNDKE